MRRAKGGTRTAGIELVLLFVGGLTVDLGVVGAAVEEDPHGVLAPVEDLVVVDLHVVAALGGDDTCVVRGNGSSTNS